MLQLLLTIIALLWAASSVLASDEQDCFQGSEPQQRIKGCTEIIQRDPDDAIAYHNRAFAYGLAGDVDSAIDDYSKVIALAPSNASAYSNRGRAYASKGDYVHAVADETRAHELLSKALAQPSVTTPPSPPKVAKKTAVAAKPPPVVPPKAKAAAAPPPEPSNNGGQEPSGGGLWSWLFGGAQAGKDAKP